MRIEPTNCDIEYLSRYIEILLRVYGFGDSLQLRSKAGSWERCGKLGSLATMPRLALQSFPRRAIEPSKGLSQKRFGLQDRIALKRLSPARAASSPEDRPIKLGDVIRLGIAAPRAETRIGRDCSPDKKTSFEPVEMAANEALIFSSDLST